jgi:hypothetical protein
MLVKKNNTTYKDDMYQPSAYTRPFFNTLIVFLKKVGMNQKVVNKKWYFDKKLGHSFVLEKSAAGQRALK